MPPGGIRTHNLSRRAAEDLRLRPRGHWEWPMSFSDRKYKKNTLDQISVTKLEVSLEFTSLLHNSEFQKERHSSVTQAIRARRYKTNLF